MADPGSLLMQGMQNMGNGLVAGQQAYQQYQQQDAAATGQVNAFLAQNPSGAGLSEDGQSLLQKQLAGNANRKDRLQLLGEIQSAQAMRQQAAATQADQAKAALLNQQAYQAQLQNQRMRATLLANSSGGQPPPPGTPPPGAQPPAAQGQPAPGQGPVQATGPAPAGTPAPAQPKPRIDQLPLKSVTDPDVSAMAAKLSDQIAYRNGFNYDNADKEASDIVQKKVDDINAQKAPIGYTYAGYDPVKGQRQYQMLYGKRGGTITAEGALIATNKPPGPVFVQNANGDYVPNIQNTMALASAEDRSPNADERFGTSAYSEDTKAAAAATDAAMTSKNLADQTAAANAAYQKGPGGQAWNAIKGTKMGQTLGAAFGDPTGQQLQNLADQSMVPLVQQLKGQGAIRNTEIDFLKAPTASPEKGAALSGDIVDMNQQKANFGLKRAQKYEELVSKGGYLPGEAASMAQQQVPLPRMFLLSQRNRAAQAPAGAKSYLLQHPDQAAHFDDMYGLGTSDVILNGPQPKSAPGS